MTSWQPIETAPKDGTFIEAYAAFTGLIAVAWWSPATSYSDARWRWNIAEELENMKPRPTHWRPLPRPYDHD